MDQDRAKSPEPEPLRTLPVLVRGILLVFAIFNLALGIVGIFVPGLPTTVFILLAAWAAAKSSPPLYRWLWNHRLFGPMLQNWASGGCVSRKAKWTASTVWSSCCSATHLDGQLRQPLLAWPLSWLGCGAALSLEDRVFKQNKRMLRSTQFCVYNLSLVPR